MTGTYTTTPLSSAWNHGHANATVAMRILMHWHSLEKALNVFRLRNNDVRERPRNSSKNVTDTKIEKKRNFLFFHRIEIVNDRFSPFCGLIIPRVFTSRHVFVTYILSYWWQFNRIITLWVIHYTYITIISSKYYFMTFKLLKYKINHSVEVINIKNHRSNCNLYNSISRCWKIIYLSVNCGEAFHLFFFQLLLFQVTDNFIEHCLVYE